MLVLAVVSLSATAAPLLTPHQPSEQFDPAVARLLPPATSRWAIASGEGRILLAERLTHLDGTDVFLRRGIDLAESVDDPGRGAQRVGFPLGTDRLGRDCWSRLLYGGRVSLSVAGTATAISMLLGTVVGAFAGYRRGAIDAVMMRLVDALMAFPQLLVVLLLGSLFEGGIAVMVLYLGATGWMPVARVVRGEVRSLVESEFLAAARATGVSVPAILVRHVVPQTTASLRAVMTLRFADVLVVESSLSFLGLGVRPPIPSWGAMIASGAAEMDATWWVATFPGMALVTTVVAANALSRPRPVRRRRRISSTDSGEPLGALSRRGTLPGSPP